MLTLIAPSLAGMITKCGIAIRYERADMNASVALFKGIRNQVDYGHVHYARLIYDPFLRLCSFWHETQIYSLNLTANTTERPLVSITRRIKGSAIRRRRRNQVDTRAIPHRST